VWSVTDYPTFPDLSRAPALKTKGTQVDPTLRDNLENGMESTRAKFTRRRRQWTVSIDFLTPADVLCLEGFVENGVSFGAGIFLFLDNRDPTNPCWLTVRFSKLPSYDDAGWVDGHFRQQCSFELREV
jgi:hypothetical protein